MNSILIRPILAANAESRTDHVALHVSHVESPGKPHQARGGGLYSGGVVCTYGSRGTVMVDGVHVLMYGMKAKRDKMVRASCLPPRWLYLQTQHTDIHHGARVAPPLLME